MEYKQAKEIADKYVEILRPFSKRIEIAGSIRREKPFCGDIEICMIPDSSKLFDLKSIVDSWGIIKGKVGGKYCARMLPEGIKLDLFFCSIDNWGLNFTIRTGSANWVKNVLAKTWVRNGYRSEGALLRPIVDNCSGELGDPIPLREEKEVFEFLNLEWIEPKDRS